MRFRHAYMGLGSLFVILLWLVSDPDAGIIQAMPIGAGIIATLVILSKSILYVGVLHLSRKALADYLDMKKIFEIAIQTPQGAGLATVAVSIIFLSVALTIYAATSS